MAGRHWLRIGAVALCGLLLASMATNASADSGTPMGGGRANAGVAPGTAVPKLSATSAGTTFLQGIDVSNYDHPIDPATGQPTPIDWATQYQAGVRFAYVLAAEGTNNVPPVNQFFSQDYADAQAAGLYTGAYAFGRPDLGAPAAQADNLISVANWTAGPLTLVPMLDMEWPYFNTVNNCYNLTPAQMVAWIRGYVAEVQARIGRNPVIYTNATWWSACVGDATFGDYPLAQASYATTAPTPPAGWGNFTIWQYAAGSSSTPADYDKDAFNGTLDQLRALASPTPPIAGSTYTPVGPTRILDTRYHIGVSTTTPLASRATLSLQVAGVGKVPATGVTGVVMNVTVTDPKSYGFLTVYPDGQSLPVVSNLNWVTGETVPNLVTVPVVDGKVDFFNGGYGSVQVIADLAGYYSGAGVSRYTPVGPTRVLDTRYKTGVSTTTPVAANGTVRLQVAGVGRVPAGVTAVTMNVTITAPTASGFLTVYPDGGSLPVVSNLNWVKGETTANLVTVPVGSDGKVDFYNRSSGTVHVIADLAGFYSTTYGGAYSPAGPVRILDTRYAVGVSTTTPVPANGTVRVPVLGANGVPSTGVTAVVLNVTVTSPTVYGFVTVYPDGIAMPLASNINWQKNQTIPNLVVVPVVDGKIALFNRSSGTVNFIADLAGYFS